MNADNPAAGPDRVPGLFYAVTDDGLELPFIDVTHPAFAIEVNQPDIDRRTERFLDEALARQQTSAEARAGVAQALQSSRLGRALSQAAGSYVDATTLYLMKIGPDHSWKGQTPIDRAIAGSFPAWTTRLRLRDMACLLAEGVTAAVEKAGARPLAFVDIAGGPAADALNAILLLRASHPARLACRSVDIHVFDGEQSGPNFGSRALAALRADRGPLHQHDVDFRFAAYDWRETAPLQAHLKRLADQHAIVAASSEGGLFEYGSDDTIAANLSVLRDHTPEDAIVVGSVTRDDGPGSQTRGEVRVATVPRSLSQFTSLAASAGWLVDTALQRPFSWQVRLTRQRS